MSRTEASLQLEPFPGLGETDNIPVPSPEILRYARENDILSLKGLSLHIVITLVVANTLIKGIQEANETKDHTHRLKLAPEVTFETMIAYHAPRGLADAGSAGLASAPINTYMKTHDDMELATFLAIRNHLPLSIILAMEALHRVRGFPAKSIGPDNPSQPGIIDWSVALTQISSWLVAGTIIPMKKRFDELIERHTGTSHTSKKLSRAELLVYYQWGNARVLDICNHIGIEFARFHEWLRTRIQANVEPAKAKETSDQLIQVLFNREPNGDEFLPITPAYKYLATTIMSMDRNGTKNSKSKLMEHLLNNPRHFLELCNRFRLISANGNHYTTSIGQTGYVKLKLRKQFIELA